MYRNGNRCAMEGPICPPINTPGATQIITLIMVSAFAARSEIKDGFNRNRTATILTMKITTTVEPTASAGDQRDSEHNCLIASVSFPGKLLFDILRFNLIISREIIMIVHSFLLFHLFSLNEKLKIGMNFKD